MQHLTILISILALAQAAPQSRLSVEQLLSETDQGLNTINVDQTNQKKTVFELVRLADEEETVSEVSLTAPSVSLGSQFAVADIFPDREGLITGHRIPIGLFPLETQHRILDHQDVFAPSTVLLPPASPYILPQAKTPSKEGSGGYINTSSFRQHQKTTTTSSTAPTTTTTPRAETTTRSLNQIRALSAFEFQSAFSEPSEGDAAYARSLDRFVPPSFY